MKVRMSPRFWLVMIVTTILTFSVSLAVFGHAYRQSTKELARINAYRDELDLEVRDLESELEYAQTDAFIIRKGRDELNLIMPNEYRYVNSAN